MRKRAPASVLLFMLVPVVNGISSLLALPAITSRFGSDGWSAIAIGFSLGTAGSIALEMGWGVDGPMRVARASTRSRTVGYVWSVRMRLTIFPLVAIAIAPSAWLLAQSFRWDSMLMAVASATVGLSPTWYFIGVRQPLQIILTDALPRLTATLAAVVIMTVGGALIFYPALLALAGLGSPFLGAAVARIRFSSVRHLPWRRQLLLIRIQLVALRGRIAVSAYRSLPVAIVGLVAPPVVPVFAAAERLQKMAQQFLNSVNLHLTGWVGTAIHQPDRLKRANVAIWWSLAFGAVSGTVFAVLAHPLSVFLFHGVATIDHWLATLAGLVIGLSCVARAFVIKLIALHRISSYSNAAWSSAVTGVASVGSLSYVWGSIGAMIGEVLAELVAIAYQAIAATRTLRQRHTCPTESQYARHPAAPHP